jgi:ethanolamine utilization protein EutM
VTDALGVLEVSSFTPAMVALDALEKAAQVRLLQSEINDLGGICLKVCGSVAAVWVALDGGRLAAESMGVPVTSRVIARVDERAMTAILSSPEFSPLIQQQVVFEPRNEARNGPGSTHRAGEDEDVSQEQESGFALGFIETQGFTAVFAAIDTACKAANVEIVAKEKLGGGFVTIVIKGDVASVKAAIEAGKAEVEPLGKLIACHVIPRPSRSVLALLP